MNNKFTNCTENTLDQVLTTEEPLVPSSGFAAGVMERIIDEAAHGYKPIEFPWRCFIPGIILLLPVLAYLGSQLSRALVIPGRTPAENAIPFTRVSMDFAVAINPQYLQILLWLAAAAVITLITWRITQRLFGLR